MKGLDGVRAMAMLLLDGCRDGCPVRLRGLDVLREWYVILADAIV